MKAILSLLISGALVVLGFGQTRNVLVGTNNAVVQPTNFWSADASNARSGLGLGSAATNDASAFQPASSVLSNLVSGGSLSFTNITVGISNVTGLQSALDGKLGTNPTLSIGNINNLQTALDGKLGTNPTLQISNIAALQTALDGKLSGSFPIAISNVSGLQTSLDGKLSTNPTLAISNISGLQTNLDSKLSLTGNAVNLTNFPASLLRATGDASGLTNFPTLNQNTTGTASNVTGVVAITNGGTGTNSAIGARQNLGLVWTGLTNTNAATFLTGLGATTVGGNIFTLVNPSAIRFLRLNADNTASALSDSDFRTAIGLGSAATNPATAFQPSSSVLTNLASSNGGSLTNLTASNVTGTIAISNGGSGATTAGGARTNLGLGGADNVVFNSANLSYINWETNAVLIFDESPRKIYGDWEVQNGALSFLNSTNAATTRTNLGLGWSGLTNTTASGFQASLFGTNTNPVLVNTNGEVVSPTNFWQVAPISTLVQLSQPNGATNSVTNAATNARNLYLYSLTPLVNNVTNTIQLPTNGGTFLGDVATVIHEGPTSSVTAVRQTGAGSNLITLNQFQEAVKFIYESGGWRLADNISYVEPIYFSGTNAAANAAASRTNLGLGATWLTNANVTNFRTAIGLGVTNDVTFSSIIVSDLSIGGSGYSGFGTFLDMEERALRADGSNVFSFSPQTMEMFVPITFNNTNIAATTRTNLGLGATDSVTFNDITAVSAFRVQSGTNVFFSAADDVVESYVPITISHPNGYDFFGTNAALAAATTRTNLGLGATNNVTFAGLTNNGDITINQTTASNGLLYIRRTNNEAFLGLANLIASNNTTVSNETLFRVGVSEATNKAAQFGFRSTNTNGDGVAVFSVFGYNALMMIGPSDPAAGTNPIEATVYSVSPTNKVATLITTNTGAMQMHRSIGFDTNLSSVGNTNLVPATNNQISKWLRVYVGTNTFYLPLYQ